MYTYTTRLVFALFRRYIYLLLCGQKHMLTARSIVTKCLTSENRRGKKSKNKTRWLEWRVMPMAPEVILPF